ncbi:hypothetical protein, partial [uncultured Fibrobacter sp.]|uniref:hypothetical protein n=1 Tax=uncultured Fibrobacter sp. TaxID=261512 RepID=UPI0025EED582
DSNPRYREVNTLSKRAPSTTRPSLQDVRQIYHFIFRLSTVLGLFYEKNAFFSSLSSVGTKSRSFV